VPRAVGLATALAEAATITASALPSGPAAAPGPVAPSGAVVPVPVGGPVPWTPASAAVPVDRMADALGDGADAARRRSASLARTLALRGRSSSPVARATDPRSARTPDPSAAPGRHRAED
jgi:hypothetical protein